MDKYVVMIEIDNSPYAQWSVEDLCDWVNSLARDHGVEQDMFNATPLSQHVQA